LNVAIPEINRTSDLRIEIKSLEKTNRRVTALRFSIKAQTMPEAVP
jgi:hypothetical protein